MKSPTSQELQTLAEHQLVLSYNKKPPQPPHNQWSQLDEAKVLLRAEPNLLFRKTEYTVLHSFLAGKINHQLSGVFNATGELGTGKTTTIRRFVEVTGLRLNDAHNAFSVIWKQLTTQTVSSNKAQTLLNEHFSGAKVREISTILLIDDVDFLSRSKPEVISNILNWSNQCRSKVIVITTANSMDWLERVVTGQEIKTLLFNSYTSDQLEKIIKDRLIGNFSFDPNAIQLAAKNGDGNAKAALSLCYLAIKLVKSNYPGISQITRLHIAEITHLIQVKQHKDMQKKRELLQTMPKTVLNNNNTYIWLEISCMTLFLWFI
ncbi:origin recognition complex subunit 1-like [Metopolophium dirhodum]|uniref:origin recognition complex subunit 1-like n=1 Tax=Metopolophium dirhodum TaxID=44670 RepID=UPI00298F9E73|nr:origin recognition complex subunit 1-like [Metopolophium dirhodum]